jgi:hypothetical protein
MNMTKDIAVVSGPKSSPTSWTALFIAPKLPLVVAKVTGAMKLNYAMFVGFGARKFSIAVFIHTTVHVDNNSERTPNGFG